MHRALSVTPIELDLSNPRLIEHIASRPLSPTKYGRQSAAASM